MSTTQLTVTQDGITKSLTAMLTRSKSMSSFLQRVIYPQYQSAQQSRWQSENGSEGSSWQRLQPTYEKYKKKKFASYPGSGEKMMIATGTLVGAATGSSSNSYKLITDTSFVVGINDDAIPYAKYAAERRTIMQFSDSTIQGWKDRIAQYVQRGG